MLLDYAHDVSEAVTALCEGTLFAEALRLSVRACTGYSRKAAERCSGRPCTLSSGSN